MPHSHSSTKYRDFEKWIEEEKVKQRALSELILEGQIFKDREGNVHSTPWSNSQADFIKNHYGEPIVRTKTGVIIQYVPKLKIVVVRKKNGQFKSKKGYGKYIKQVLQIQLEQKAKSQRLSGKERRKLKKLHRRERKK